MENLNIQQEGPYTSNSHHAVVHQIPMPVLNYAYYSTGQWIVRHIPEGLAGRASSCGCCC